MFGLKKKRDMDFSDIRSGVLSQPPSFNEPDFPPRSTPPPEFEDMTRPSRLNDRRFDDQPRYNDKRFDDQPRFNEPPGFGAIDVRNPVDERNKEHNYDIIERLNMIESQLAAIRSQTETINERLKNMERLLPRRY